MKINKSLENIRNILKGKTIQKFQLNKYILISTINLLYVEISVIICNFK